MAKILLNIFLIFLFTLSCKNEQRDHLSDLHSHKNVKQFRSVDDFYFVGETELNPGIYIFNFMTKKSKLFWNSRTEKVIDLAAAEDFKTAFFITAIRYGFGGSFPFIEKARLYRINPEIKKAEFIRDIGNIIQLYSYWTPEGNYNLTVNYFDPKINTYVIQNVQLYNQFGRILSDHSETSDLIISGYPKLRLKEIPTSSYDGRYRIFSVSDSIFIRDNRNKAKIFVKESNHRINSIEWIHDKSFVVFTTLKSREDIVSTDDFATLNIFDLNQMKLIKSLRGSSSYRFAVTNEFLIFESGFQSNSTIKVLSLEELGQTFSINIRGGCGLRNIPQHPYQ